jgi:hypothetical protein
MQYPHSKLFTGLGPVVCSVPNTTHFPLPFRLHVEKLMNTMTKPRSLPHTFSRWVRVVIPYYSACVLGVTDSDVHLVLNPKEKMGYFKKHWPVDVQDEVRKCVEEEVYLNLLIFT